MLSPPIERNWTKMDVLRFTFVRSSFRGSTTSAAYQHPGLTGEVKDGYVHLTLYGQNDYGLRTVLRALTGGYSELALPYEGSATYDMLKALYAERVGTVKSYLRLQDQPKLQIEEIDLGWMVPLLGGAEHEHFDGLADRLRDQGCEAQRGLGPDDKKAVFFRLPNTGSSELDALIRLRSAFIGGDA